ncbi:hypothetical protein GOBAR_AA16275 [Gossypium barbadense]|uniref:Uncharacterized protein n=1 Tax=Gossypium barbadense TaxID=3634 RepID=A0A2P5XM27_GOSBA|nr:hypothetical protein GOBAR_AA16275 [Gossypium barbadense]
MCGGRVVCDEREKGEGEIIGSGEGDEVRVWSDGGLVGWVRVKRRSEVRSRVRNGGWKGVAGNRSGG